MIDALAVIHENYIYHLDLRPKNILLHKISDGTLSIKLNNFGNAVYRKWVDEKEDAEEDEYKDKKIIGIANPAAF